MSSDKKYRFTISIPFKNPSGNNTALVIMKNPSKANKSVSDRTINSLINKCYSENYSSIIVMNIFPYYSTPASGVKKFIKNPAYNKIMQRNLVKLSKKLNCCTDIIIAWGTETIGCGKKLYNDEISKIINLIQESGKKILAVKQKSSYPRHPLKWGCNVNLDIYPFNENHSN